MSSSSWLVVALALSFRCVVHSATVVERGTRCQDGLMSADAAEDSRSFPVIEGRLADEDGTKRIFILSDLGWRDDDENKENFTFNAPFTTQRRPERTLFPAKLKDEHRDAEHFIPVTRRDLDNKLLRCMIGRVYRPCWQA